MSPKARLLNPAGEAWRRYQELLEAALAGPRPWARFALVVLLAGMAWWAYVPLHELAHAGACVSCGGEVRRMTLAPIYGGSFAARRFDWIDDRTPYAGQLADFTPGSDACYLWLVLAPFAVTPLARPLLRRSGGRAGPLCFAAGSVLALMPLASVTGDFYEAASIIVTGLVEGGVPGALSLRSDDLPALVGRLASGGAETSPGQWVVVALGVVLGLAAAVSLAVVSIPAPGRGKR